jgi:hypothetical protein
VILFRGVKIYSREVLSCWRLTVAQTTQRPFLSGQLCRGQVFLIWKQFWEVDFNMEADSGGSFNMEADFRGSFQYGGRFRGQNYLWRWISEAFVLLGIY